ncbi:MAG: HEAT repeat domain-containing protein [Pirellulales bacterium]
MAVDLGRRTSPFLAVANMENMNCRVLARASVLWLLSLTCVASADAQNSLEREISRLAFQLEDDKGFDRKEAAEALLRINPQDVSPELRKQIARSFKEIAFDKFADDDAINGLALWGGKYSVPLLIELLERERHGAPDAVYDALAKYPTPESAEALARKLGDFFAHDNAVRALRRMGSAAEPALLQAAPSRDPKVSVAAVQLLGDVGTEKSIELLRKASSSRNVDVRDLAKASLKKIRDRAKNGSAPAAGSGANSPFSDNAAAGPAAASTPAPMVTAGFGSDAPASVPSNAADDDGWGDALSEPDADRGDWSQVNALLPGEPEGSVTPDATSLAPADWKPKPIRLMAKEATGPSALAIGGERNAPIGAVTYSGSLRSGVSRIELVDFKRAKSLTTFVAPEGVQRCAVSPSGERMLCTAVADMHRRESRLSVWDIAKGEPMEKVSWSPYAAEEFNFTHGEVPWVDWLDDSRLITVNGSGQAVMWDVSGAKPKAVYQIDGIAGGRATLSPGRTYFALSTPRGVELFRARDGALLSRMEVNTVPGPGSLAFDPEGRFLTLVSGKRIYYWDAVSGKQFSDFYCEAFAGGGDHAWVGDDLILANGDLIDLKQRRILWRYDGAGAVACNWFPHQWIAIQNQTVRGLLPFQLPHDAALAARQSETEFVAFVTKPGASITVDNQVSDENRDAIEAGLQQAVKQCGLNPTPDQSVRLVVRLGEVKSENTSYRRFGESLFSEGEKVTVETGRAYEATLEVDRKVAWRSQSNQWSGGAPFHVQMKEGETIQQAVDRVRESRKGKFVFAIPLPQYIVHPDKAGPAGTSKLTLAGIQ